MEKPTTLLELYENIINSVKDLGYAEEKNALFRDCITVKNSNNSNPIRKPNQDEANFWFGFVREDQGKTGAYDGLSFVIFPPLKLYL